MGDQATTGGRPGYWFPLALLGFGLLVLLGYENLRTAENFGWVAYAPADGLGRGYVGGVSLGASYPERSFTAVSVLLPESSAFPMRDFPWFVLVMTTLVGTVAWYGWLARKAGNPVRPYVLLALGCLVAVPAAYVATGMASAIPDADGMVTSVG
jgi:hypothetical protein